MSKVVFLSNVDRRFAMMKVALQQLQQENLLSNDSVCVKLSDNTVWNDEWQKLLEAVSYTHLTLPTIYSV